MTTAEQLANDIRAMLTPRAADWPQGALDHVANNLAAIHALGGDRPASVSLVGLLRRQLAVAGVQASETQLWHWADGIREVWP